MPKRSIREPRIQADCRDRVRSHGPHRPRRICLHDTEGHDTAGVRDLEAVADYWHGQGEGFGSHIGVDSDGNSARYVDDHRIAWHVGGGNTDTLGIEQIGFARFGRTVWLLRPRQLEKVARWLAWWHVRYDIPLVRAHYIASTGTMSDGVFTHADWSRESGRSDHFDPGVGYPFWLVLFLARQLVKKGGWS